MGHIIHAQQPELVLPIGHIHEVISAEFSPDGKTILTTSIDNTAKLWDAATGNLLANLQGHSRQLTAAHFSPDGKKIITASWDGLAKLWDALTGKLLLDLTKHSSVVNDVAFSPDGKKVVTGSWDHSAIIWDVATGSMLADLRGHTTEIFSVAFSADGKKIITTANSANAKVWDAATGLLLLNLKESTAVFSPDGRKIAAASDNNDYSIKILNVVSGNLLLNIQGHRKPISKIVFSPDGKKIFTAASDSTAKIWNAATGKMLAIIKNKMHDIADACFSPDGKKIVTCCDSAASVWDANSGELLARIRAHSDLVNSARYSADGKKIVTASSDRTAKIFDAANGHLLADLKGHTNRIEWAEFNEDGKEIVTASDNHTSRVWDAFTGEPLVNLKDFSAFISFAHFNKDGKKIMLGSGDSTISIFDAVTGNLLVKLKGHSGLIYSAQFSPDGEKIVTASGDSTAKLWDAATGLLLADLRGHSSVVQNAVFSKDGKKVVTASWDHTAKVWDANTGMILANLKGGHTDWVEMAGFSQDGKKIVTASSDSTAKIWDAVSGNLLFDLKGHSTPVTFAQFTPDGKNVLTDSWNGEKIWDASSGVLLKNLMGHSSNVTFAQFSPDTKKIVTSSWDNTAKIWDASSGNLLHDLKGHSLNVQCALFSPDGKKIVTASIDNTCKIWNAATGELLYTFFTLDSSGYFNFLPSGYYKGTRGAGKLLHYISKDLKVITFEQLDVKYNRPDKVLQAMGNTDTALISSYRNAYIKRIKKLGVDTTAFRDGYSIPEADFVSRDAIASEQKNEKLVLHIKGRDSIYALDRFNCWVNEVPLFGIRGINIKNQNSHILDTTITITLSDGENRIETSITNVNGTESYHMPLVVNYKPVNAIKEKVYFIGIGIDRFADARHNLTYSTKDIRDLCTKLKAKFGNSLVIDTLLNEKVTVSNVKALKNKLLQTTVNDKVIISYSGHGLLSKDYDYYLSSYSVNFKNPEENGLPYDELENLLDSIPARKKLMLIDACHSGEIDKDEYQTAKINQSKLADNHIIARGAEGDNTDTTTTQKLGLLNSFELMQSLFVNVGRSTGATIISAAGGTEFALENGNLKNGVFTYSVMEAMDQHPVMKISELQKIVGARVEQLTNGMQKPTSRNEAIAVDWNVW